MLKTLSYIFPTLLIVPMMASAQFGAIDTFFTNIKQFIGDILIPLVITLALLVFIWGIFKYFILGGGDSDSREEGRQLMLYAVIGFVAIVSIWGIVNLLSSIFPNTKPPEPPSTL